MIYSTGLPNKNSFYEFSPYNNPKKIEHRVNVIEWLIVSKKTYPNGEFILLSITLAECLVFHKGCNQY